MAISKIENASLATSAVGQSNMGTGVAGTGPAFSAYNSSNTSLTQNTFVKMAFQTEEFDTNNCFDNSTNYRFTPNVAGYYQFNAAVAMATYAAQIYIGFYKNGSNFKMSPNSPAAAGATGSGVSGSALIYLNGTTDYVEVYIQQSASTQNAATGAIYTWFQGFLARAA